MTVTYNSQSPVFGFAIDGFLNATPSSSNDGTISYASNFKSIYIDTGSATYGQSNTLAVAGQQFILSSNYSNNQSAHLADGDGNFYRVESGYQAVMNLTFKKPDGSSHTETSVNTNGITLQPVDQSGIDIVGASPIQIYMPLSIYGSNTAFQNYTLISTNVTSTGQFSNNYIVQAMSTTLTDISASACLVRGTKVLTEMGNITVETLKAGDRVWTLDHGFQPICWIGSTTVCGLGKNAPIRVLPQNAKQEPLFVSPQHRLLMEGIWAEPLFGEESLLVAAKNLVHFDHIQVAPQISVEYFHFMFDQHEIILANNHLVESLFVSDEISSALPKEQFDEIAEFFPEKFGTALMDSLCRTELTRHESRVLAQLMN